MSAAKPISFLRGARKEFERFPIAVQQDLARALTMAAAGGKHEDAKPFKGVGGGVFEIALRHRGDAFRAVYVVQVGEALWVIDAFQKKSTSGIKTPHVDVDRIKERLKRLKEALA